MLDKSMSHSTSLMQLLPTTILQGPKVTSHLVAQSLPITSLSFISAAKLYKF